MISTCEILKQMGLTWAFLSLCPHNLLYTANEGLVRIQYKCLVPIYVFPEMKLQGLIISKTEL